MGRLFAAISVLALLGARWPGGFEPDPESAARKIGFFDRAAVC